MPPGALLNEVEQLRQVCLRLDQLCDLYPLVSDQLAVICGHIRNSAALLEVMLTIKFRTQLDGH